MLAENSSISLAGSEEQIIFFQQSPKMLRIVSVNFIHALLLFLGLFLKISRWVPLTNNDDDGNNDHNVGGGGVTMPMHCLTKLLVTNTSFFLL